MTKTYEQIREQEIAKEIMSQIKCLINPIDYLSWGVKSLLTWKENNNSGIMINARRNYKVTVVVNGMDLYDIKIMKYIPKKLECETLKIYDDIYAEEMPDLINDFFYHSK